MIYYAFQFAGFGKSSSREQPKSDLLTEAEYQVTKLLTQSFEAENTSGNFRISDLGGGFFANETNCWTLDGILSRKLRTENTVIFTRIDFYLDWIQSFEKNWSFFEKSFKKIVQGFVVS